MQLIRLIVVPGRTLEILNELLNYLLLPKELRQVRTDNRIEFLFCFFQTGSKGEPAGQAAGGKISNNNYPRVRSPPGCNRSVVRTNVKSYTSSAVQCTNVCRFSM